MSARQRVVIGSSAHAFEWLAQAVGTDELADICTSRDGRRLVYVTARTGYSNERITGEELAGLVQARHELVNAKGAGILFPITVARRVAATPSVLPNVQSWISRRPGGA